MADLATASMKPWTVTIEGTKYKVQKITMGDIAGVAQSQVQSQRDKILSDETLDKKDRINKANEVKSLGAWEIMDWMLEAPEGLCTAIYLGLHKQQPDITYDLVLGLVFCDDLVQLAYEILGVRRQVVESKDEVKKKRIK